jgi:hypothetical protein
MSRKSWIQIDGKLIPKEEYHGNNVRGPDLHVLPDITPFVSPIDGKQINSRPQLREHNKKHGVTNSADYSPEYYQKRKQERLFEQARHGRNERIELMKRAMEK